MDDNKEFETQGSQITNNDDQIKSALESAADHAAKGSIPSAETAFDKQDDQHALQDIYKKTSTGQTYESIVQGYTNNSNKVEVDKVPSQYKRYANLYNRKVDIATEFTGLAQIEDDATREIKRSEALMRNFGYDYLKKNYGQDLKSVNYWHNKFKNNDYSNPLDNDLTLQEAINHGESMLTQLNIAQYNGGSLTNSADILSSITGEKIDASVLDSIKPYLDPKMAAMESDLFVKLLKAGSLEQDAQMLRDPSTGELTGYLHTDGKVYDVVSKEEFDANPMAYKDKDVFVNEGGSLTRNGQGTGGTIGEGIVKGLGKGLFDVVNIVTSAVVGISELWDDDADDDMNQFASTYTALEGWANSWASMDVVDIDGETSFKEGAQSVSNLIGSFLPDIALMIFTAGTGTAAKVGATTTAKTTAKSITKNVLEETGQKIAKDVVGEIVEDVATKGASKVAKETAEEAVEKLTEEAVEEMAEQAATKYVDNFLGKEVSEEIRGEVISSTREKIIKQTGKNTSQTSVRDAITNVVGGKPHSVIAKQLKRQIPKTMPNVAKKTLGGFMKLRGTYMGNPFGQSSKITSVWARRGIFAGINASRDAATTYAMLNAKGLAYPEKDFDPTKAALGHGALSFASTFLLSGALDDSAIKAYADNPIIKKLTKAPGLKALRGTMKKAVTDSKTGAYLVGRLSLGDTMLDMADNLFTQGLSQAALQGKVSIDDLGGSVSAGIDSAIQSMSDPSTWASMGWMGVMGSRGSRDAWHQANVSRVDFSAIQNTVNGYTEHLEKALHDPMIDADSKASAKAMLEDLQKNQSDNRRKVSEEFANADADTIELISSMRTMDDLVNNLYGKDGIQGKVKEILDKNIEHSIKNRAQESTELFNFMVKHNTEKKSNVLKSVMSKGMVGTMKDLVGKNKTGHIKLDRMLRHMGDTAGIAFNNNTSIDGMINKFADVAGIKIDKDIKLSEQAQSRYTKIFEQGEVVGNTISFHNLSPADGRDQLIRMVESMQSMGGEGSTVKIYSMKDGKVSDTLVNENFTIEFTGESFATFNAMNKIQSTVKAYLLLDEMNQAGVMNNKEATLDAIGNFKEFLIDEHNSKVVNDSEMINHMSDRDVVKELLKRGYLTEDAIILLPDEVLPAAYQNLKTARESAEYIANQIKSDNPNLSEMDTRYTRDIIPMLEHGKNIAGYGKMQAAKDIQSITDAYAQRFRSKEASDKEGASSTSNASSTKEGGSVEYLLNQINNGEVGKAILDEDPIYHTNKILDQITRSSFEDTEGMSDLLNLMETTGVGSELTNSKHFQDIFLRETKEIDITDIRSEIRDLQGKLKLNKGVDIFKEASDEVLNRNFTNIHNFLEDYRVISHKGEEIEYKGIRPSSYEELVEVMSKSSDTINSIETEISKLPKSESISKYPRLAELHDAKHTHKALSSFVNQYKDSIRSTALNRIGEVKGTKSELKDLKNQRNSILTNQRFGLTDDIVKKLHQASKDPKFLREIMSRDISDPDRAFFEVFYRGKNALTSDAQRNIQKFITTEKHGDLYTTVSLDKGVYKELVVDKYYREARSKIKNEIKAEAKMYAEYLKGTKPIKIEQPHITIDLAEVLSKAEFEINKITKDNEKLKQFQERKTNQESTLNKLTSRFSSHQINSIDRLNNFRIKMMEEGSNGLLKINVYGEGDGHIDMDTFLDVSGLTLSDIRSGEVPGITYHDSLARYIEVDYTSKASHRDSTYSEHALDAAFTDNVGAGFNNGVQVFDNNDIVVNPTIAYGKVSEDKLISVGYQVTGATLSDYTKSGKIGGDANKSDKYSQKSIGFKVDIPEQESLYIYTTKVIEALGDIEYTDSYIPLEMYESLKGTDFDKIWDVEVRTSLEGLVHLKRFDMEAAKTYLDNNLDNFDAKMIMPNRSSDLLVAEGKADNLGVIKEGQDQAIDALGNVSIIETLTKVVDPGNMGRHKKFKDLFIKDSVSSKIQLLKPSVADTTSLEGRDNLSIKDIRSFEAVSHLEKIANERFGTAFGNDSLPMNVKKILSNKKVYKQLFKIVEAGNFKVDDVHNLLVKQNKAIVEAGHTTDKVTQALSNDNADVSKSMYLHEGHVQGLNIIPKYYDTLSKEEVDIALSTIKKLVEDKISINTYSNTGFSKSNEHSLTSKTTEVDGKRYIKLDDLKNLSEDELNLIGNKDLLKNKLSLENLLEATDPIIKDAPLGIRSKTYHTSAPTMEVTNWAIQRKGDSANDAIQDRLLRDAILRAENAEAKDLLKSKGFQEKMSNRANLDVIERMNIKHIKDNASRYDNVGRAATVNANVRLNKLEFINNAKNITLQLQRGAVNGHNTRGYGKGLSQTAVEIATTINASVFDKSYTKYFAVNNKDGSITHRLNTNKVGKDKDAALLSLTDHRLQGYSDEAEYKNFLKENTIVVVDKYLPSDDPNFLKQIKLVDENNEYTDFFNTLRDVHENNVLTRAENIGDTNELVEYYRGQYNTDTNDMNVQTKLIEADRRSMELKHRYMAPTDQAKHLIRDAIGNYKDLSQLSSYEKNRVSERLLNIISGNKDSIFSAGSKTSAVDRAIATLIDKDLYNTFTSIKDLAGDNIIQNTLSELLHSELVDLSPKNTNKLESFRQQLTLRNEEIAAQLQKVDSDMLTDIKEFTKLTSQIYSVGSKNQDALIIKRDEIGKELKEIIGHNATPDSLEGRLLGEYVLNEMLKNTDNINVRDFLNSKNSTYEYVRNATQGIDEVTNSRFVVQRDGERVDVSEFIGNEVIIWDTETIATNDDPNDRRDRIIQSAYGLGTLKEFNNTLIPLPKPDSIYEYTAPNGVTQAELGYSVNRKAIEKLGGGYKKATDGTYVKDNPNKIQVGQENFMEVDPASGKFKVTKGGAEKFIDELRRLGPNGKPRVLITKNGKFDLEVLARAAEIDVSELSDIPHIDIDIANNAGVARGIHDHKQDTQEIHPNTYRAITEYEILNNIEIGTYKKLLESSAHTASADIIKTSILMFQSGKQLVDTSKAMYKFGSMIEEVYANTGIIPREFGDMNYHVLDVPSKSIIKKDMDAVKFVDRVLDIANIYHQEQLNAHHNTRINKELKRLEGSEISDASIRLIEQGGDKALAAINRITEGNPVELDNIFKTIKKYITDKEGSYVSNKELFAYALDKSLYSNPEFWSLHNKLNKDNGITAELFKSTFEEMTQADIINMKGSLSGDDMTAYKMSRLSHSNYPKVKMFENLSGMLPKELQPFIDDALVSLNTTMVKYKTELNDTEINELLHTKKIKDGPVTNAVKKSFKSLTRKIRDGKMYGKSKIWGLSTNAEVPAGYIGMSKRVFEETFGKDMSVDDIPYCEVVRHPNDNRAGMTTLKIEIMDSLEGTERNMAVSESTILRMSGDHDGDHITVTALSRDALKYQEAKHEMQFKVLNRIETELREIDINTPPAIRDMDAELMEGLINLHKDAKIDQLTESDITNTVNRIVDEYVNKLSDKPSDEFIAYKLEQYQDLANTIFTRKDLNGKYVIDFKNMDGVPDNERRAYVQGIVDRNKKQYIDSVTGVVNLNAKVKRLVTDDFMKDVSTRGFALGSSTVTRLENLAFYDTKKYVKTINNLLSKFSFGETNERLTLNAKGKSTSSVFKEGLNLLRQVHILNQRTDVKLAKKMLEGMGEVSKKNLSLIDTSNVHGALDAMETLMNDFHIRQASTRSTSDNKDVRIEQQLRDIMKQAGDPLYQAFADTELAGTTQVMAFAVSGDAESVIVPSANKDYSVNATYVQAVRDADHRHKIKELIESKKKSGEKIILKKGEKIAKGINVTSEHQGELVDIKNNKLIIKYSNDNLQDFKVTEGTGVTKGTFSANKTMSIKGMPEVFGLMDMANIENIKKSGTHQVDELLSNMKTKEVEVELTTVEEGGRVTTDTKKMKIAFAEVKLGVIEGHIHKDHAREAGVINALGEQADHKVSDFLGVKANSGSESQAGLSGNVRVDGEEVTMTTDSAIDRYEMEQGRNYQPYDLANKAKSARAVFTLQALNLLDSGARKKFLKGASMESYADTIIRDNEYLSSSSEFSGILRDLLPKLGRTEKLRHKHIDSLQLDDDSKVTLKRLMSDEMIILLSGGQTTISADGSVSYGKKNLSNDAKVKTGNVNIKDNVSKEYDQSNETADVNDAFIAGKDFNDILLGYRTSIDSHMKLAHATGNYLHGRPGSFTNGFKAISDVDNKSLRNKQYGLEDSNISNRVDDTKTSQAIRDLSINQTEGVRTPAQVMIDTPLHKADQRALRKLDDIRTDVKNVKGGHLRFLSEAVANSTKYYGLDKRQLKLYGNKNLIPGVDKIAAIEDRHMQTFDNNGSYIHKVGANKKYADVNNYKELYSKGDMAKRQYTNDSIEHAQEGMNFSLFRSNKTKGQLENELFPDVKVTHEEFNLDFESYADLKTKFTEQLAAIRTNHEILSGEVDVAKLVNKPRMSILDLGYNDDNLDTELKKNIFRSGGFAHNTKAGFEADDIVNAITNNYARFKHELQGMVEPLAKVIDHMPGIDKWIHLSNLHARLDATLNKGHFAKKKDILDLLVNTAAKHDIKVKGVNIEEQAKELHKQLSNYKKEFETTNSKLVEDYNNTLKGVMNKALDITGFDETQLRASIMFPIMKERSKNTSTSTNEYRSVIHSLFEMDKYTTTSLETSLKQYSDDHMASMLSMTDDLAKVAATREAQLRASELGFSSNGKAVDIADEFLRSLEDNASAKGTNEDVDIALRHYVNEQYDQGSFVIKALKDNSSGRGIDIHGTITALKDSMNNKAVEIMNELGLESMSTGMADLYSMRNRYTDPLINQKLETMIKLQQSVGEIIAIAYSKGAKSFNKFLKGRIGDSVLTDRGMRKVSSKANDFSMRFESDIISIREHIKNGVNGDIQLLADTFMGNNYVTNKDLANQIEKEYYKVKVPGPLQKKLAKAGSFGSKFIMGNPLRFPERALRFALYDVAALSAQNPKTMLNLAKAQRALKQLSHVGYDLNKVRGEMGDMLREYYKYKGQVPKGSGETDRFNRMNESAKVPIEPVDKTLNWVLDATEVASDWTRIASFMSNVEDIKKGKMKLGNMYNRKEMLENFDDYGKAFQLTNNALATPGHLPLAAKKASPYLVFTSFTMGAARSAYDWGSSAKRAVTDAVMKGDTSGIYSSLFIPGMTMAGMYMMANALMDIAGNIFGVDEETLEEYKKDQKTIDLFGTVLNDELVTRPTWNPLTALKNDLLDPFTDGYTNGTEYTKEDDNILGAVKGFGMNTLAKLNPLLKIPMEVVTQNDIMGAVPTSTKNKYGMFENITRKMTGMMIGNSLANKVYSEMKHNGYTDEGFMTDLASAFAQGLAAETGNSTSYKRYKKDYYTARSIVLGELYGHTPTDVDDTSFWKASYSTSGFNSEKVSELSRSIKYATANKESQSIIYGLILDGINSGMTETEVKAAINANTISGLLSRLDNPTSFLNRLSDKKYKILSNALAYDNSIYPIDEDINAINPMFRNGLPRR